MTYLELNYFDSDFSAQQKMLGAAWHLIHAISSKNDKAPFQVAFPFWTDPVRGSNGAILKIGTFGPVMRVFGDSATLGLFSTELNSHRIIRSGLVTLSEIRKVPEHATSVSFVRSRARDRVTEGFAARAQRNSENRALRGSFKPTELHRGALIAAENKVLANFVSLKSSATGHCFSLNVERRAVDAAKQLNSYGLGGTVPQF